MTTPDRVYWCTGSDEEWTELTEALMSTGTFVKLDEKKKPNSFYAASDPTDVARVEDRTFICSVDEKDCGPTNNWMAPERDEADHARAVRRLHEGPHDVRHPVRDGPPRGRATEVRRRDHRLGVRHRQHARDGPHGLPRAASDGGARRRRRGRALGPGPAQRRHAARARPGRREVAVQRHQVHRAVPRGAGDLVVRLRLRRQRAARQEVLRPAHRQRDGPRRGLARRAHADPQADQPRRASPSTSPPRSPAPAARPTWRCSSRPSRAGRSSPSATTSPGCASARTAGCGR